MMNGQCLSAQSTNEPFEDALKSFYMEDLNVAVIHLKNALKNNPLHLPSRILMAEILIAQGNGAGAEIELEFAAQGNADDKKIVPLLLEAYLLQNKHDQVINKASIIEGEDKLSSKILVLKGRALFQKNSPMLALAEYKQALSLNSRNADAMLGLAQVYYKRNQYDMSMKFIDETLSISPLNTNAMQMKASIFQLKGEINEAILAISDAININEKHFPALLTRAGIFIEQKQYEDALNDLQVILTDIPNEPRANYLKAVASQALGLNEEFVKTASHLDVVLTGIPEDVMKENPIYHYLAGLVNFEKGEFLKAQVSLRNYIEIVNDDIRALKLIAKVEFALEEGFSAKNYLVKARLLYPDDVEVWSLLGRAYFLTGDVEKAELYFSDVVKSLPSSAGALVDLGQLQFDMGQNNKAIESFIKARELSSNDASITFKLASAYKASQQFSQAIALIKELIEQDSNSSYLYQQYGVLLGLTNQHEAAKDAFNKARSLDPTNLSALIHLARIDVLEEKIESARSRLKAELINQPNNPMLLSELGDTYKKSAEIEQAKQFYEKAYSLNRNNVLAVSKVIDIYDAQNNTNKAIEIASDFLSRNNEVASLYIKLGYLYVEDKKVNEAINAFQLAVKHSSDKSKMLVAFSNAQLRMRDSQGAISSLQKAIAWNEENISAYIQLIGLFVDYKDEENALALIQRLSDKLAFPAFISKLRGDVYLAVDKLSLAEIAYKKSIALDNSQKATFGLSETYKKQKREDEALLLLQNWHMKQPQNVVMAVALADLHIQMGNFTRAADIYESQIKLSGNMPVLLNNAALVYLALDKSDIAIGFAKQAFEQLPNNVAIMDTMAWAYTKNNQPDKALSIFRDALAVDSGNAEIKYHLAVSLIMLDRKAEAKNYLEEAIASQDNFSEKDKAVALLQSLTNR